MTDQRHPITPPPELVEKWYDASVLEGKITYDEFNFANLAARWGADQELEACCGLIGSAYVRDQVRAARRPKPPSLREQALQELERVVTLLMPVTGPNKVERFAIIRRALEQLDD